MRDYHFDLSKADTREFFDEHGFAVFRNVFTQEEIGRMRSQLYDIFRQEPVFPGDWNNRPMINGLRADLFNRYPQLRWIFYKPEMHAALRKVLSADVAFVSESVAHYKGFGNWHKDTTSQEKDGQRFQYEPNWLMVECALYLQDNHPVYGGGLDVVPGSHRHQKDDFIRPQPQGIIDKVMNRVGTKMVQARRSRKGFHIPSKAGDFVFFNKKLDHRSSPCTATEVPPEKEKLAIFFVAGVNNEHLVNYTRYIGSRPGYVYMKHYQLDDQFRDECHKQNIHLIDPSVVL